MQITIRYIAAFIVLSLLIQEMHELAHMLADHFLQGCGGVRYFLYWNLCETGDAFKVALTSLAGPCINFFFLWLGYWLLARNNTIKQKSWGFTLVLATLPLQRLQAFVFRGSDEITAFKKLMLPSEPFKGAAVIAGLLLMLLMIAPPLYKAFKQLERKNQRAVMTGFLILPFLLFLAFLQVGATESAKELMVSSPGIYFLPSWLVLLDILLVLLFIPVAKSVGNLFNR